ncbi:hypothetical protein CHCC20335_0505 [Bacillus paralicheniformis]|nr:hypothetical protein CHCC20335_0505 [Bacillus paralicheniformis]
MIFLSLSISIHQVYVLSIFPSWTQTRRFKRLRLYLPKGL